MKEPVQCSEQIQGVEKRSTLRDAPELLDNTTGNYAKEKVSHLFMLSNCADCVFEETRNRTFSLSCCEEPPLLPHRLVQNPFIG